MATKKLVEIGEPALPNLRGLAIGSPRKEVRERAKSLYDKINSAITDEWRRDRTGDEKRLQGRIAKELSLGIDFLVGRLLRDRSKLDADDWAILSHLEESIKVIGDRSGVENLTTLRYKKFGKEYVRNYDLRSTLTSKCISTDVLRAATVSNSLLLCQSELDVTSSITRSVALIQRATTVQFAGAVQTLFLVNGDLKNSEAFTDCVIVSNGDVKIAVATRTLVIAKGSVEIGRSIGCTIRQRSEGANEKMRFFSSDQLGLFVAPGKAGIEIRSVAKNSVFAAAGLSAGDMLLAIDKQKVESADTFQAILLQSALGGRATLLIERNGKELRKDVELKLW
jgi:hypothetical protein